MLKYLYDVHTRSASNREAFQIPDDRGLEIQIMEWLHGRENEVIERHVIEGCLIIWKLLALSENKTQTVNIILHYEEVKLCIKRLATYAPLLQCYCWVAWVFQLQVIALRLSFPIFNFKISYDKSKILFQNKKATSK